MVIVGSLTQKPTPNQQTNYLPLSPNVQNLRDSSDESKLTERGNLLLDEYAYVLPSHSTEGWIPWGPEINSACWNVRGMAGNWKGR